MYRSSYASPDVLLSIIVGAIGTMAATVFLVANGWVSRLAGLDLLYLLIGVSAGAVFLFLSRIAALAQGFQQPASQAENNAEDHPSPTSGSAGSALTAMAAARMVLEGLAVTAVIAGLLATIPQLATSSFLHDSSLMESVGPYLEVFRPLALWISIFSAVLVVVRGIVVTRPLLREAMQFPFSRLVAFAVAYIIFSGSGLLSVSYEYSGGFLLLFIALGLALSYVALVLSHAEAAPLSRGEFRPARIGRLAADLGWMAMMMGVMVVLPAEADRVPVKQFGSGFDSISPYLGILDSLALWSVILIAPFMVIRVVAAFRPDVGEVFGFPAGHMLIFGFALVLFSNRGIAATASEYPIPDLMPVLMVALAVSYATDIIQRAAQVGPSDSATTVLLNLAGLAGPVVKAVTFSLIVWAVLDSLPLATGPLLTRELTADFAVSSLPYFANLFDARYLLAGFVFILVLSSTLPNPLWGPASWHLRPLITAMGFTASACLLWMSGGQLSGLGHSVLLVGAVGGLGLLSLGLCELAEYARNSREPLLAEAGNWLRSSRLRGFMLGAALAFYAALLRPLMYDTLWLAEIYEWLAVLVFAILVLTGLRGRLRPYLESADASDGAARQWGRHQQSLENRPDSRGDLLAKYQQTYVESGQWADLWMYLMGLLYRNNALLESAHAVTLPLRNTGRPDQRLRSQRRTGKVKRQREVALAQCLQSLEDCISDSRRPHPEPNEETLEELSEAYIESGVAPETIAAAVIDSYVRNGADLNRAVTLWFPIVSPVDRPPRWFDFPWVAHGQRVRAQARRRHLVEGAIAHLAGDADVNSLPVAIAVSPVNTYSTLTDQMYGSPGISGSAGAMNRGANYTPSVGSTIQRDASRHPGSPTRDRRQPFGASYRDLTPAGVIAAGEGFEILNEAERSFLVRTANGVETNIIKAQLERQAILPGDEVNEAQ